VPIVVRYHSPLVVLTAPIERRAEGVRDARDPPLQYKGLILISYRVITVVDMPFSGVAQEHDDGDRARATELRAHPAVGIVTAFDASRSGRIWTTLFGQCAGPPR
jgi:hypothetical protein